MKKILCSLAVVALVAGALCLCACSSGNAGGASEDVKAKWETYPTTPLKLYTEVPADEQAFAEAHSITPAELEQLMSSGEDYVIVDVNSASMYADGHIEGAVNYPWNMSGFTQDPELPRGVKLVFYCVCAEEEDSMHMAFSAVKDFAYRNIVLLKGGSPAWVEAGHELVK